MPRQKISDFLEGNEETNMDENKLKIILRGVSKANIFGEDGSQPAEAVEKYVSSFINQGYKLFHVSMVGQDQSMVQMIYVLVKE